jgi:hypothetical protein
MRFKSFKHEEKKRDLVLNIINEIQIPPDTYFRYILESYCDTFILSKNKRIFIIFTKTKLFL